MISRCIILHFVKKLRLFYFMCSLIFIAICVLYLFLIENIPKNEYQRSEPPLHTLCLIVPFRNRFEELMQFVPHISKFLNNQDIHYYVIVMNQVDEYRFNRGALLNIGFKISIKKYLDCDYFGLHDVDLLPLNENILYSYPGDGVFHVSSPNLHPRYHYQTFIGGIMLITKKHFTEINGMSNRYWGWGLEDDEMYLRLKEKNIKIFRPGPLSTNHTNTFKHIHGPTRKRDMERCYNQTAVSVRRDRITGISNVAYEIVSKHTFSVDNFPFDVFNLKLECDKSFTPWCICPPKKAQPKKLSG